MKFRKTLFSLGACFTFSFASNAIAANCSGTEVSSCTALNSSSCTSTSYIYNSCKSCNGYTDGQCNCVAQGVYCAWNENDSGDCNEGAACS
jgi:hypothetical protein